LSFARDALLLALGVALSSFAALRFGAPLLEGLSRAERWAWAFWLGVLGTGIVYCVGLVAGAGGPSSRFVPSAVGFAFLAAALIPRRRRAAGAENSPKEPLSRACRALLAGAGAAVLLFSAIALSEPMWANDFLAIWGFKGKTIFLTGSIPGRLFHDPMTAWSHPEYPLLLPGVLAAFSTFPGVWDDHALALIYPLFALALLAALFGAVRRRFSGEAGGLAALLAAGFFPLFRAQAVGMAEIPLAAVLVLFSVAVLDFIERPSRAAGARLAIAALSAAMIKQEGALFVLFAAIWIALAGRRRPGRFAISFLSLAAAPVICHQLVQTALRGRIGDRDYDLSLARPENWPLLLRRAADVAGTVFRSQLVPAAAPLAAFAVFLLFARPAKADRALFLLGPPLFAQTLAYAAVCTLSAYDPVWQAQFLPRLAGALFPVLLLAAAPRLQWIVARRGGVLE